MAAWLYRIGEAAARRAWTVILIWALIIAGGGCLCRVPRQAQQYLHHAWNADPAALR